MPVVAEGQIRLRAKALPSVHLPRAATSSGWSQTATNGGVRIVRRDEGSHELAVSGDLVVDATSRGSARQSGWSNSAIPTQGDRVKIGIGHADRSYRLRPGALGDDKRIVTAATQTSPCPRVLALRVSA